MEEKLSDTSQELQPRSASDLDSQASEIPPLALGPYGDIPAAYAVLRVDIDETAGKATDSCYIFASERYRQVLRRDNVGLIGRSHLTVGEIDGDEWLAQCYRVVVNGETISGFEYNPLVRDWIGFTLAPSKIDGCCVYAFMNVSVDAEQRRQLVASADARTSLVISEMLSALSAEQNYETAMNGVLRMMSNVISTDRLMIFECNDKESKVAFELCAEGVDSQLGTVFALPSEALKYWFRSVAKDPVALIPDVSILEHFNVHLYEWCQTSNVKSLMATPFINSGEIVGFLGAYNYQIDEDIDLNRLFSAVSAFIGARIDNRRLIDNLAWAGEHDALTGLLNRRGERAIIDNRFLKQPLGPHVLALIDIDDFKETNDTYGHSAGDVALRTLAEAMNESFPPDAILARHGGDEFLLMLSGDDAENADTLIADFSNRKLEYEFEGQKHVMGLSIGYARYPDQASEIRKLYSNADAALYSVKLGGKAGFKKFSPYEDA